MYKEISGEGVPFAFKIKHLLDCYKKGEFLETSKKLQSLRFQIASTSNDKIANLAVLLDYIEKKIPFIQGTTPDTICYDSDYFKLLRGEYSKIHLSSCISSNNSAKDIFNFNVINGARPTVFWGKTLKQVLGRDQTATHISEYDQVSISRRRLLESHIEKHGDRVIYITTPSYNSIKYIDSAILSVISQEGPFRINYHVQDGGSSDGTIDKLLKWQTILSDQKCDLVRCQGLTFTFQSEKDSGMYDAINKGFEALTIPADGICSWINSDDIFAPGALASVWEIFTNNCDAFWIIGATNGAGSYLEELSLIPLQFPQEVIRRGLCDGKNWRFIQQEGSVWRRNLWSEVGGLNPSLRYCGDWDLWRRFAQLIDPIHVEWSLGRFRKHKEQLTSSIKSYYQEMASVISWEERKKQFEALWNVFLPPTKMVRRPNRKDGGGDYDHVPLQRQYVPNNTPEKNRIINRLLDHAGQSPLKVMTLCTLARGGAGTGSLRRVEALRDIGVDAKLLALVSGLDQGYVGRIVPTLDRLEADDQLKIWNYIICNIRNTVMHRPNYKGQELFSLTESVIDMKQLKPLFDEVDIIHMHWVVGMLDYKNMADVLANKPIVWTTGDMNPFTGGCHYSEGCEEFMRECRNCPMLSEQSNLPHEAWQLKKRAYDPLDITVVCPSEYIASMVRKSSLLGDKTTQVIANAYPVNRIHPVNQDKARIKFKLPQDKKLLMFGAEDFTNLRKGGDLAVLVLDIVAQMSMAKDIEIVLFGQGQIDLPLKVNCIGTLGTETLLSEAYSAVNAFISLSREDVGPMTVVEAMLCGTPVIGFGIGVLPEVVTHKSTGYCAENYKVEDIVSGINWALQAVDNDKNIGDRCRSSAMKYADPKFAAEKHREIYQTKARGN